MIALKKLYGDELLRIALVLSLLKADPNEYLERETQQLLTGLHISNGSDWSLEHEAQTLIRPPFVHPKSLDNILVNYERQLFEELNSLGRYGNSFTAENNDRIWNVRGPVLHTYLLNNVATDTVAPALAQASVPLEPNDNVSADENVAEEVKISDEDSNQSQPDLQPDAIVTLSADFVHNHTDSDIFDEIASRSFDVNQFLIQPNEMQIKKEHDTHDSDFEVRVKKEQDVHDLYSDNAIDDFVPYFSSHVDKFEIGETNSIFDQNMADLQDYRELFDNVKEMRELEYLDVKHKEEDLEQYLLENTPLDAEVYELAPIFEEELMLDVKRERASTSFTSASSSGVSEMDAASVGEVADLKLEPDEGHHSGDELTQADIDLIEVLWKQDVDMGYTLESPLRDGSLKITKAEFCDDVNKELKLDDERAQIDFDSEKVEETIVDKVEEEEPLAELSYSVDTEAGEYVIGGELPHDLVTHEERFDLLEEALHLVELGDEADTKDEQSEAVEGSSSGSMLHPAMRHVPHHPLAHYHNQSLMRSMSVEQRWQDLASLLTIPPPPDQYQHYHHQHPHNISGHGSAAGYTPNYHTPIPPAPDKHHEVYGAAAPLDSSYKVEAAHHPQQHDGIYYQQNTPGEMAPPPPNPDGFLQSILNDEDLQLMDMAMNEGMYTMRMLDSASAHHPPHHNHTHMMMTERDSASDSAVSSMGSERVPSLSDGEWCDGSDSAQDFHSSKFRPYDATGYVRERNATHHPQKKHHMFGKRCFQEPTVAEPRPPAVKYECGELAYSHHDDMLLHNPEYARAHAPQPAAPPPDLAAHALLPNGMGSPVSNAPRYAYASPERIRHNHTYSAPLPTLDQRPPAVRDKRVRRLTDGSMSDGGSSATSSGHLTRDEKRAKALGIPLEVHDIINLPMDEFNERLSKHDLSEAQLSLIRDIRRRGKNKVAAQNCRKRKLDQITSLADEVRSVRDRKQRTQREHHHLLAERHRLKDQFAKLYRHVFQNLRDPDGRPLSSNQFSLQQAADGNVVLVPKMPQHPDQSMNRTSEEELDRKTKHYEH